MASFERFDVVCRHADEALHQRSKASLHLGVAGRAECGNAAAVKGFFIDHHFRAFNAFVVAKFARQLQGSFVSLKPG